jgi:hypothetical protein
VQQLCRKQVRAFAHNLNRGQTLTSPSELPSPYQISRTPLIFSARVFSLPR